MGRSAAASAIRSGRSETFARGAPMRPTAELESAARRARALRWATSVRSAAAAPPRRLSPRPLSPSSAPCCGSPRFKPNPPHRVRCCQATRPCALRASAQTSLRHPTLTTTFNQNAAPSRMMAPSPSGRANAPHSRSHLRQSREATAGSPRGRRARPGRAPANGPTYSNAEDPGTPGGGCQCGTR